VPADAPLDEQDTLRQAAAVTDALSQLGHDCVSAPFVPDATALESLVARECPDVVFNLAETVWGKGIYAALAPAMLTQLGIPFTGGGATAIAACGDKLFAKRVLSGAKLPTPPWSEAPLWSGIADGMWIVKSVTEDASIGLDDGAVVRGRNAVAARAQASAAQHGGRWFAERYIDGREFNVPLIERDGRPFIPPIGEMRFEHWDADRPRIVGYAAKWESETAEYRDTRRSFGWRDNEPELSRHLERLAKQCWELFGLSGYARVDFRVDQAGSPYILEINPNPSLDPDAGVAAACEQAGLSYAGLIDAIVRAALD
jgi:D-alanine-D-alanine ligase